MTCSPMALGGHLAFVLGLDGVEHVLDEHRDLLVVDRALVAGGADGAEQFVAVEGFLAAVALDHDHAVADEKLRGGEAVAAFQAFARRRMVLPSRAMRESITLSSMEVHLGQRMGIISH